MPLHCISLFNSYIQTYNDVVSQFVYLQNIAVLQSFDVKSTVYLNKPYTNTFCRRGYGLKENYFYIYFCRITIPAFHSGDLKGSYNYRSSKAISPFKVIVFQEQNK